MKFLGTLVNVLAIIVASGMGAMFRGKLRVKYQRIIVQLCGFAAILIGVWGIYTNMFYFPDGLEGEFELKGTMLIFFAIITGRIFGEGFGVSHFLYKLGGKISAKTVAEEEKDRARRRREAQKRAAYANSNGKKVGKSLVDLPTYNMPPLYHDDLFAEGFVLSAVLVGFSHLAVNGALADGMSGNPNTLYIKTVIDVIIVLALSTVYGSGVSYSAVAALAIEGVLTFTSMFFPTFFTPAISGQLAVIGAIIVIVAGVGVLLRKKLKAENMIPAFLIPVIYYLVVDLATKLAGE